MARRPSTASQFSKGKVIAKAYTSPTLVLLAMDWPDGAKFNDFFGKVVEGLANAAEKPHWKPGSPYAPK